MSGIELEKARLELEQQKTELASARADIQAKIKEAITDMADAGAKTNQQSRAKVSDTPGREDYLRSRFSATDIPMKEETPRLIACVPRSQAAATADGDCRK